MCYTFGRFLKQKYKVGYHDATVSFLHPVTGLFPHANPGELFVFLGISAGFESIDANINELAMWYFIVGLIVIFIRGTLTEKIYNYFLEKEKKAV